MHSRPNELAGQRERSTPLPCPGLGGEALGAGGLVEVGLSDRGVDLVAPGRARALVFVIDVRRRLERMLESHRAQQGGWPPKRIDLPNLIRDIESIVPTDLLFDQVLREDGQKRVGRDRLFGSRMERRRHRLGKIRAEMIPLGRNLRLGQSESNGWFMIILRQRCAARTCRVRSPRG